jgi:hypothetical protein
VQPSVQDYYRTVDSWKAELQRLDTVSERKDARVKAALDAVAKLSPDRRDAIKSLSLVLEALDTPKADDGWQSAGKRATMKALQFDTKARNVKP